jgi:hypothetical protein
MFAFHLIRHEGLHRQQALLAAAAKERQLSQARGERRSPSRFHSEFFRLRYRIARLRPAPAA